nr:NADH dehydrogenase subunit 5 [Degeeriella rufa]
MNLLYPSLLLSWLGVQLWVFSGGATLIVSMCLSQSHIFPEMVFVVDWMSGVFLSMVLAVSALVMMYTREYMKASKMSSKFSLIMAVFVVSMLLLSISGDVFWVMVGWDGLGISSFCLVIFFQNWKAVSGGMVTFLSNRFGDLFMLSSLACLMLGWSMTDCYSMGLSTWLGCLLMIGGATKSAQVPFSAWLPMAMAAPTPVSSLVHSSTLVTAGVYLMSRFMPALSEDCLHFAYIVSSATIVVAGSASLFEWDFKKIIALSTLLHVGLMVNVLSLGSTGAGLIHMFMHAFFKSMLFMSAGVVIHSSLDCQDLRRIYFYKMSADWVAIFVSFLSMMGLPFLAGFCSKELVLSALSACSAAFTCVPFLVGALFTVMYSTRVLLFLLRSQPCGLLKVPESSSFCSSAISMSIVLSTIGSSWMWVMPQFKVFFIGCWFESILKTVLLTLFVVGGFGGVYLSKQSFVSNFFCFVWKCSSMAYFSSQWICDKSWKILNKCDTKGVLSCLVSDLVGRVASMSHEVLLNVVRVPLSVLSIFGTISTTCVILSVFSV